MYSKRLSTFLSKPDLSFFFLDECPLQSFSYWVQKSGPSLSLPSFSHVSYPVRPQILSAVLSQHVHNLTTFHHLMSITLVQTAPISLLDYCNSFLLAYSLALPSPFHILARPIDYSPLLLKILHGFSISLVIKWEILSDVSPRPPNSDLISSLLLPLQAGHNGFSGPCPVSTCCSGSCICQEHSCPRNHTTSSLPLPLCSNIPWSESLTWPR